MVGSITKAVPEQDVQETLYLKKNNLSRCVLDTISTKVNSFQTLPNAGFLKSENMPELVIRACYNFQFRIFINGFKLVLKINETENLKDYTEL